MKGILVMLYCEMEQLKVSLGERSQGVRDRRKTKVLTLVDPASSVPILDTFMSTMRL